jgi:FAD/FMN-containing dehydrogenase
VPDLVANLDVDAQPSSVAVCRSTDDVVRAVASTEQPLAIRGGGYSPAGLGTVDGGTVIDVGPLRSVAVDPATRQVRVGGGATAGAVDAELQRFGLAATLPVPSRAGVVGAALSGGVGFLVRKLGLSCDAIVGATVVTAAREVVDAAEPEHEDLLWALRGGGGNFGVVTELVLQGQKLREVTVAQHVVSVDEARGALRFYRDWTATISSDLTPVAMLRGFEGRPALVVSAVHAGSAAEAERELAPLAARREQRVSLANLRAVTDAAFPHARFGVLARSGWADELSDAAIDDAVAAVAELPPGESMIEIARMRGAVSDVDGSFSAAPGRDAEFFLNVLGLWLAPEDSDTVRAWVGEADCRMRAMRRSDAVVPGFVSADELSLAEVTYGPYVEALRRVKRRYDPQNRFARNLNVRP